MSKILISILAFSFSCKAATPVVQFPQIRDKQQVENKVLPERPDSVPIPAEKDWAKSMVPNTPGSCATESGVLLSPEKAARAKQWQLGYNALRDLYEIDREVWRMHRAVYEDRNSQANEQIKKMSPSWWDENRTIIGWTAGFLVGAATTVTIVYGVERVK